MSLKILITGSGGQLGSDLVRVLSPEHDVFALTRKDLDVTEGLKAANAVRRLKPDIIIHAAAFTNVDQAETDKEAAYRTNALGTKNMAVAATIIGAKLVYISTDYVFDGKKGSPYTEFDSPCPLGVYGYTKLLGEKFVESLVDRYFIVRTSWLFGMNGNNFVKKMVSLMKQQRELPVVQDQIGSPTYSLDLAEFISHLIHTEKYGMYHTSNKGYCSRYELADEIKNVLNLKDVTLVAAKLEQFKLPAQRPANSSLDDLTLRIRHLPVFRDWKSALHDYLNALREENF